MKEERKFSEKREKPRKGELKITDDGDEFQYIKEKIIDGPRSHNIQPERDFYEKTSEEDFSSSEEVTETSSDDKVDPDEALEGHSCESCGSVLSDAQLRSRRILSASDESYSSPPTSSSSSVVTTSSEEERKSSKDSESYILPICDSCDLEIGNYTSYISCPKHGSRQHRQTDQKKKRDKSKKSSMYT